MKNYPVHSFNCQQSLWGNIASHLQDALPF
jgi:hypothetical protein